MNALWADDDLNQMWHDEIFMFHNPLNEETVLQYFSKSPFYDRTCNNAICAMQGLPLSQLPFMVGVEYELLYERSMPPVLFVIAQNLRVSPTEASRQALFYIINAKVYKAPTLFALMRAKLMNAEHFLVQAFKSLEERASHTMFKGYSWDAAAASEPDGRATEGADDEGEGGGGERLAEAEKPQMFLDAGRMLDIVEARVLAAESSGAAVGAGGAAGGRKRKLDALLL